MTKRKLKKEIYCNKKIKFNKKKKNQRQQITKDQKKE